MPIRFACPNCGRVSRADDNWAGRKARCPGCQQLIQVPAASNVGDEAPTPAASDPAKTVVETSAATTQAIPPVARQPQVDAHKPAASGAEAARPQRSKIELSPHPEARPKTAPKPQLRPRPAAPHAEAPLPAAKPKPQPAAEEEPPQKPQPKPKPAAVPTDGRPVWMQAKKVGMAAVGLSTLGFLTFLLPYVGVGLSVLGILAGIASIGLSLFDRGVGLGYGLAAICVGMMGFVPGYVRTRQSMVSQGPPAVIRQACSCHHVPYPRAMPRTFAAIPTDVASA